MSDSPLNLKNALLTQAISPASVQGDGKYTNPRTYGVYRLEKSLLVERQFRFGNHPVRQTELFRDYGVVELVALFLDREQAKDLAFLMNGEEQLS